MAEKRTIMLLGQPVYDEDGVASAAITPGMLIDGVTSVAAHAVAGGACPRAFAMERDEMGKSIDDAYAIGDTVKRGTFHQGERVLAFIASGQNIALNARLESAGNGYLRVFVSGTIIGRALEALNNSAGPGPARIRVEVM